MLPLSRCFLRHRFEIPKDVLLSGKGVRNRDASKILSILKVFTVKNSTLTFDCRSDDQRIVPRQVEPGSNSVAPLHIKLARSALTGVDETWSTSIVLRRRHSSALRN